MLATLLESQHRRTSSFPAQLLSAALHTGLILGAVFATKATVEATAAPEAPTPRVWLPPPPEPAPGPIAPPLSLPQLPSAPTVPTLSEVPAVLPSLDLLRNLFLTNPDELLVTRGRSGVESNGAGPTTNVRGMTADQVDRPAQLLPGSGRPIYPPQLRSAGLGGEVLVQFVIDTAGRADMATLAIIESSHAWLTSAVKRALETARFAPAEFGGRKVRQIVRMPFVFSLQR